MVRKEVCRLVLQNGEEIKIEREILHVKYNPDSDTIKLEMLYYFDGYWSMSSIRSLLNSITDVYLTKLNIQSDDTGRVVYYIEMPTSELEQKLPIVLKEHDDKVINAIKEIINKLIKIRNIVERYL